MLARVLSRPYLFYFVFLYEIRSTEKQKTKDISLVHINVFD